MNYNHLDLLSKFLSSPLKSRNVKICLVASAFFTVMLSAQTRTWTAANGSHQFEGKFVSIDGSNVKIIKDGKKIKVPKSRLSAEDLRWLNNQGKVETTEENKTEEVSEQWGPAQTYQFRLQLDPSRYKSYWGRENIRKTAGLYEYAFQFLPPVDKSEDQSYEMTGSVDFRIHHEGRKSKLIKKDEVVELGEVKFSTSWLSDHAFTVAAANDDAIKNNKRFVAFNDSFKPLKKWPGLNASFQVKIKPRVFSDALHSQKWNVYKTLKREDFPEDSFTPSNLLPPPDMVSRLFKGKNRGELTALKVIDSIGQEIKKQFKLTNERLYSQELSALYESKMINNASLARLFQAYCSAVGIPCRTKRGFVVELKSATAVEYAAFRSWSECFIPEVGWVPVDMDAFLHNPRFKNSYIANNKLSQVIRLPISREQKGVYIFHGTFKRKDKEKGGFMFTYERYRPAIRSIDIKRVQNK